MVLFLALFLNVDNWPLSYFPLSLWSWPDTINAIFLNSVISLIAHVKAITHQAFNQFNAFYKKTAAPFRLII
jgi:hypothetical protein|tara:strand:- start:1126 stop:1341 length:216 start_codon:yes stop_codon:yes gene_type:complete